MSPSRTDEIRRYAHSDHFDTELYRDHNEKKTTDDWTLRSRKHAECVAHLCAEFTSLIGSANKTLKERMPDVWRARASIMDAERVLQSMHDNTRTAYILYHKTYRMGSENADAKRKVEEAFNMLSSAEDLHSNVQTHINNALRYYQAGYENGRKATHTEKEMNNGN